MTHEHENIAVKIIGLLHEAELDVLHRDCTLMASPTTRGSITHVSLDDHHGLKVALDDDTSRWYPISAVKCEYDNAVTS